VDKWGSAAHRRRQAVGEAAEHQEAAGMEPVGHTLAVVGSLQVVDMQLEAVGKYFERRFELVGIVAAGSGAELDRFASVVGTLAVLERARSKLRLGQGRQQQQQAQQRGEA